MELYACFFQIFLIIYIEESGVFYFCIMMKANVAGHLILGSGSPRRKEILSLADIDFEVLVSDVDESYGADIAADDVPELLAIRKARAIQQKFSVIQVTILTADTVVIVDEQILGKPVNRDEAIQMLQKLSGKKHKVITGVCCLKTEDMKTFKDVTWVTFSEISLSDIEYYVDKYQPYDKAGSYAIQEWIGVRYISKIEGCYYNVMGLPLPLILPEII